MIVTDTTAKIKPQSLKPKLTFDFQRGRGETGDLVIRLGEEVIHIQRGDPRRESFRRNVAKSVVQQCDAMTQEAVLEELMEIAKKISLPDPDLEEQTRQVLAMLEEMENRTEAELRLEMLERADERTAKRLDHMPDQAKRAATEMLNDPRLVDRIIEDIRAIGIVGEQEVALTLYVLGVSRLLDRPLAAIVQGITASGKSFTIEKVMKFFPDESRLIATDITPNALYYLPSGSLMHKCVVAGERSRLPNDERAEASRALREMIASGELRKAVPENINGVLTTVVKHQHGPIAFVESTTVTSIFDEDANRCLLLGTDESSLQTRAVIQAISEGAMRPRSDPSQMIEKHHAAQRMLRRVNVVIPYADLLAEQMPDDKPEARRAISHAVTMIGAIALLHQRQRADSHALEHGDDISASLTDYAIARRLLIGPLGRSLGGDLPQAVINFGHRLCERWRSNEFTSTQALKGDPILGSKSKVNEHLHSLEEAGCAEIVEPHKGSQPATWQMLSEPPEPGARWLPEPEILRAGAVDAA